ncbi:histidine kinase [Maribacter sp.]|uniref:sensor histidine kinase n=1 Tax=Maribacter sp. TaxID=1897614 RepID=UPI0025C5FA20|nr:histidine kinase [Maribacter sp.]
MNIEKRIKYLGFNDFWFSLVGILIISFATYYLFNPSLDFNNWVEAVLSWVFGLMFTIIDWTINRSIMIFLRKKFPAFRDDAKRIIIFFLAVVCTVILVDFLGGSILSLIPGINVIPYQYRIKILLTIVFLTVMIMAIYEAIYYNIRLKKSVREEEQSKQILIQAQLDALQNQAQPHFFFNTLNTLRDIIDQNPKEDAMEFVDKLSDIYRFLLEAGNDNLIPLNKELKFAKAYIHIQTERFGDNLKLNWDISKASSDAMVVPMSLQLLLENAIKHNVISKSKPLTVDVAVQDNNLVVSNKMEPKSTQVPSTKVGLANIKKRYALISGKSIEITNIENRFMVSLPLLTLLDKKN